MKKIVKIVAIFLVLTCSIYADSNNISFKIQKSLIEKEVKKSTDIEKNMPIAIQDNKIYRIIMTEIITVDENTIKN